MKHPATEDDRVWRALSDGRRRRMLDRLADAPMTTGSLVHEFEPLCRTAVMKHLDVLVAARLVLVRWEGRVRWNHFNPVLIDGEEFFGSAQAAELVGGGVTAPPATGTLFGGRTKWCPSPSPASPL